MAIEGEFRTETLVASTCGLVRMKTVHFIESFLRMQAKDRRHHHQGRFRGEELFAKSTSQFASNAGDFLLRLHCVKSDVVRVAPCTRTYQLSIIQHLAIAGAKLTFLVPKKRARKHKLRGTSNSWHFIGVRAVWLGRIFWRGAVHEGVAAFAGGMLSMSSIPPQASA